ncbi:hypothetical protein MHBO_000310 [Bonamia ostreae]|uniref:Amino acid transporter transmembrane domain-containing protein n=1 Tax=Bonamia ostreae TaxID=126728 RepID=A0ABV2AF57_9EUKA
MCDYVCVQLIKMTKKKNVETYESLAEQTLGGAMYYIICLFCFLSTFGAMMGYSEIIHSSNIALLGQFIKNDPEKLKWASLGVTIGLFFVFVMPYAYWKDLSSLSWMSVFSLVTFGVIAVIITVSGALVENPSSNYKPLATKGIISAFGTLSFAFVCTDSIFPVYLGLRDRTQLRWNKVMHTTVACLGLLYGVFASICYFLIPNLANYVLNSPSISGKIEVNVAKLLLNVTLLLTFLTKIHVTRTYLYSMIEKSLGPLSGISKKSFYILHMGSTSATVVVSITLGILTGDLMFIVSLTGLLTSTAIGYVIPVVILFKIKTFKKIWNDFKEAFTGNLKLIKRLKNVVNFLFPILIFVFGVVGFCVGVPLTIIGYIDGLQ